MYLEIADLANFYGFGAILLLAATMTVSGYVQRISVKAHDYGYAQEAGGLTEFTACALVAAAMFSPVLTYAETVRASIKPKAAILGYEQIKDDVNIMSDLLSRIGEVAAKGAEQLYVPFTDEELASIARFEAVEPGKSIRAGAAYKKAKFLLNVGFNDAGSSELTAIEISVIAYVLGCHLAIYIFLAKNLRLVDCTLGLFYIGALLFAGMFTFDLLEGSKFVRPLQTTHKIAYTALLAFPIVGSTLTWQLVRMKYDLFSSVNVIALCVLVPICVWAAVALYMGNHISYLFSTMMSALSLFLIMPPMKPVCVRLLSRPL